MRKVDHSCQYDKSANFWLRKNGENYLLGLSDWGQYVLGTFVAIHEFPEPGTSLIKEQLLCLLESNKAANEILMPIAGKIIAVNPAIIAQPEIINLDCYATGWLVRLTEIKEEELTSWDDGVHYKSAIDGLFRK